MFLRMKLHFPGRVYIVPVIVESSCPMIQDVTLVVMQPNIALPKGDKGSILGVKVTFVLWLLSLT